jgi:ankyrin repeat protein
MITREYQDVEKLLLMPRAIAAAQIGTTLLKNIRPHQILWHPQKDPVVSKSWDHIQASIRENGVVGSSLILALAYNGHKRAVELLVDKGANINMESLYYQETPLMLAAKNGHEEVVQLLVERGADVNIKNYDLSTALIIAVFSRNMPIIRILVESGIKVNAINTFGDSALDLAKKLHFEAAVDFLSQR